MCALTTTGSAYCWGDNFYGQLGNGAFGNGTDQSIPTAVSGGHTFTSITAGRRHTCALTADGVGYCWGENVFGQLGTGSATSTPVPAPTAVSGGLRFTSITAGSGHTCALTTAGAGYCWGSDNEGQLGGASSGDKSTPTAVTGGLTFTSITAGRTHTCALTAAGAGYCWGSNGSGQLGDGTTLSRSVPTAVSGGLTFTNMSAGSIHTCAFTAAGAGYCWGSNFSGELGDGTTLSRSVPTAVSGGLTFTNIQAYDFYTCSLVSTGAGYCWGGNSTGQLGNGESGAGTNRLIPTAISGGLAFSGIATGSTSLATYGILRNSSAGSGPLTYFIFLLPDGRECTSISPMRVEVGSMVTLPGVDALCRTIPGATVNGWTIPVQPGFTGYGSSTSPFPPGLQVLVVDSQSFTVVPREPVLTFHYDANVAAVNPCVTNNIVHTRGRIADVWVPRADVGVARFPTQAACTPPGHALAGWNTRGDGTGTTYQTGAALPTEWARVGTNTRTLFATWKPVAGTMPTVDRASAQEARSIAQERASSRQH